MPHRLAPAVFLCLAALALGSESPVAQESDPATPSALELRGRISGPDGTAVVGARIRILPETPGTTGESPSDEAPKAMVVESGEGGSFTAAGLVGGETYRIRVEAVGFAPFCDAGILADAVLNVRLEPGYPLAGRVLELRGSEPIAGASITACDAEAAPFGEDACLRTSSGDDGGFALSDLRRGTIDIEVLAAGHALERLAHVAVPASDASEGSRRLEIFLRPGADIAGVVLDLDDRPVPNATVTITPRDLPFRDPLGGPEHRVARTDAAGRFEIEGVRSGSRYELSVSAEGYASTDLGPLEVEPGRALTDLRVRLGSGAKLTVKLVDEDEAAVTALEIELDSNAGGSARGRSRFGPRPGRPSRPVDDEQIESQGEGRFRVSRLPAGTYTVRLLPEDHADIERENVAFREGSTVELGTIVVRRGETIEGSVRDDLGEPIAGAEVRAIWQRDGRPAGRAVRTDVDGKYRVPGLDEGPAQLWASAEGYVAERRSDVPSGERSADFALRRTGSVTGFVALDDGGIPSAFQIKAHPEAGDEPESSGFGRFRSFGRDDANIFSSPDGSYRVDGLAPGAYTLEALAGGSAPGKAAGVVVTGSGVTDAGVIVLGKGATLSGRVLAAGDDSPVAGAGVTVSIPSAMGFRFEAPSLGATTVTGRDGSFVFDGVGTGAHTVTVEHPEYSAAETRVAVEEGVPLPEIVVHLSKGGTITGTVRDGDGGPVPEESLLLMGGPGTDLKTAVTDADGRYTFERVVPATYRLSRAGGIRGVSATGVRSVTVEEGRTVVVDFDEQPAVRLSGFVLRGNERIADATLFFVHAGDGGAGSGMSSARSGADGAYEVGLASGGAYRVTVQIGRIGRFGAGSTVELSVPEEAEVVLDIVVSDRGIAGTVTDANGLAVSGAMVMVEPVANGSPNGSGGLTDGSGAYSIEGLEAGSYRVSVSAAGFSSEERPVEVSDAGMTSGVDFSLEAGRVVKGRVVDPGGGGLSGAIVIVTQTGSRNTFARPSLTDVNGVFTATAPSEGPVDVTAVAGGWAPARRAGIVPREGEEILVAVSAGGSVEIRALGPDGRPAPGILVRVAPVSAFPGAGFATDTRQAPPTGADGVASVDLLAPGSYEITVPARRDVVSQIVAVTEGATTRVVLDLP